MATDKDIIVNNAHDAAIVIDNLVALQSHSTALLRKKAAENAVLRRRLSARRPAIALNAALLKTASENVHALLGAKSRFTAEDLANAWQNRPDTMLQSLAKIASKLTSQIASGSGLGVVTDSAVQSKTAGDNNTGMGFYGSHEPWAAAASFQKVFEN